MMMSWAPPIATEFPWAAKRRAGIIPGSLNMVLLVGKCTSHPSIVILMIGVTAASTGTGGSRVDGSSRPVVASQAMNDVYPHDSQLS